jgi:uncharacterized repeat protein (TIGR03803 family)
MLPSSLLVRLPFDGAAAYFLEMCKWESGLIQLDQTLYGATVEGGAHKCGTIFSIGPSGYSLIHSFGCSDGAHPYAGLTDFDGTLYGTTLKGGNTECDCGEVFEIKNASSGPEFNVIYAFKGGTTDGARPYAGLIYQDGKLYGTTSEGGSAGVGTVFSVEIDGTEHVLYSFKGGSDGEKPYAGLIYAYGGFYGTQKQAVVIIVWVDIIAARSLGSRKMARKPCYTFSTGLERTKKAASRSRA